MEYITESIYMEKEFPFAVYKGRGFTPEDERLQKAYMHNHHCLEINLCLSGEGQYYITDDIYPVQKDDIFIINNLEYHMTRNCTDDLQLMVIVFDPQLILAGSSDYQYIRAFFEWKSGFKHRLSADTPVSPDMMEILKTIQREWDAQATGWRLVVKSLLLMLLALLYRQFEEASGYTERIQKFQSDYIKLAPAIRYMEENFMNKISLQELAEKTNMNMNYLSALFSKTMGCTVFEYLIQLRLRHACMLLNTTNQSIMSVALESGFGNSSYFNRVFHKAFGLAPKEYRKGKRS